jgi:ABC-type uncharacterized transport system permease subunit
VSAASATVARWARESSLVAHAAIYELRKQLAFRAGFIVREVLRNVARPIVMICVYWAIFRAGGASSIGSYSFPDLVRYMVLVAILQRLMFNERSLDLADSIFNGTLTKFLVMPVRYACLPFSRFVEHTLLQAIFASVLWIGGALAHPPWWPFPASALAAAQALVLLVLASYCYYLAVFVVNLLAFWLDVVWTLLVMARFVTLFVGGVLVPVTVMPHAIASIFRWLFPYWMVTAPIEIWMGKQSTAEFRSGLAILAGTIALLELVRRWMWRCGLRRYTGTGM